MAPFKNMCVYLSTCEQYEQQYKTLHVAERDKECVQGWLRLAARAFTEN